MRKPRSIALFAANPVLKKREMRPRTERLDAIARILKWVIGVAVFLLAAFFLLARLQHGSYFYNNHISVDRDKSIVYDSFGQSPDVVIGYLGAPFKVQDLRDNEQLMYWLFDPVTLQIHFHKDRVSRMAYFSEKSEIRQSIANEIIALYGENAQWESGEPSKEKRFSKKANRMLEIRADSVLVYGYIKK